MIFWLYWNECITQNCTKLTHDLVDHTSHVISNQMLLLVETQLKKRNEEAKKCNIATGHKQTEKQRRKKRIGRISIRIQGRNTQEKVGPITMQYSKLSEGIWSFLSPSWLVLMNYNRGWKPASHTLQRKSWGQTCIHTHSSVNMTNYYKYVYKYFFVCIWFTAVFLLGLGFCRYGFLFSIKTSLLLHWSLLPV